MYRHLRQLRSQQLICLLLELKRSLLRYISICIHKPIEILRTADNVKISRNASGKKEGQMYLV